MVFALDEGVGSISHSRFYRNDKLLKLKYSLTHYLFSRSTDLLVCRSLR